MDSYPTYKGFVEWANEAKTIFYWTDGLDVYRSPITNVADVESGYTAGRWEASVIHWNMFAKQLNRKIIEA